LKLLAVTVLTSADDADLRQDGYAMSVSGLVELRVRNAIEARMDGLICSPLEVAGVRGIAGAGPILVTPGVRSAGAATGDQKRVATPAAAIANGADYVVIGRQITRAADPRGEMLRVIQEMEGKSPA
jgi:orotidine-5'-phosphate decarboxylase